MPEHGSRGHGSESGHGSMERKDSPQERRDAFIRAVGGKVVLEKLLGLVTGNHIEK